MPLATPLGTRPWFLSGRAFRRVAGRLNYHGWRGSPATETTRQAVASHVTRRQRAPNLIPLALQDHVNKLFSALRPGEPRHRGRSRCKPFLVQPDPSLHGTCERTGFVAREVERVIAGHFAEHRDVP